MSKIPGLVWVALLAPSLAAVPGCGGEPDPTDPASRIASNEQALGEPTGDRPNYQERVALYQCNKSRAEPAATHWPSFKPVPPLLWHDQLAQSSRAHSTDMRDNGCFM